jgi:hypothetical protein
MSFSIDKKHLLGEGVYVMDGQIDVKCRAIIRVEQRSNLRERGRQSYDGQTEAK